MVKAEWLNAKQAVWGWNDLTLHAQHKRFRQREGAMMFEKFLRRCGFVPVSEVQDAVLNARAEAFAEVEMQMRARIDVEDQLAVSTAAIADRLNTMTGKIPVLCGEGGSDG
jgi:hypothetical protein